MLKISLLDAIVGGISLATVAFMAGWLIEGFNSVSNKGEA